MIIIIIMMYLLPWYYYVAETPQENAEEVETDARYKYPAMSKTQGGFRLRVTDGEFTDSQIIVMLGENGTGKTTFIRMLVSILSYVFESCKDFLNKNTRNFTYIAKAN